MSTCPRWSETCPLRSLPCLDLGQGSFRARAVPTLCPCCARPGPCLSPVPWAAGLSREQIFHGKGSV